MSRVRKPCIDNYYICFSCCCDGEREREREIYKEFTKEANIIKRGKYLGNVIKTDICGEVNCVILNSLKCLLTYVIASNCCLQ